MLKMGKMLQLSVAIVIFYVKLLWSTTIPMPLSAPYKLDIGHDDDNKEIVGTNSDAYSTDNQPISITIMANGHKTTSISQMSAGNAFENLLRTTITSDHATEATSVNYDYEIRSMNAALSSNSNEALVNLPPPLYDITGQNDEGNIVANPTDSGDHDHGRGHDLQWMSPRSGAIDNSGMLQKGGDLLNLTSLSDHLSHDIAIEFNDQDHQRGQLYNSFASMGSESDIERIFTKYEKSSKCLLDDFKDILMWWAYANGTLKESNLNVRSRGKFLDFSFRNYRKESVMFREIRMATMINTQIIAFSAANNNLTKVPYKTLMLMQRSLEYLSLKGNQFTAYTPDMQKDALDRILAKDECGNGPSFHDTLPPQEQIHTIHNREKGIAWATFPHLPNLIELDISNCHIEFVTKEAFQNLTNLRRLYMSHNKMWNILSDTFQYVPKLQYLDLSFTNVLDFTYELPMGTLQAIINLIYGVKIQQATFKYLTELVYLDLSHTKLTRNSAVAFTYLGENFKYLSLCYTAFPLIGNALFKNTRLVGLDLSGNSYASYNMIEGSFEGISDTMRYLYFEHSNVKSLAWLRYLGNLTVLGLTGNNINTLSFGTFGHLKNLQILDLSDNHISNWYNRVFTNNKRLRLLNLRHNNINILTSEMLKDFESLDYLGLSDNDFVCDCLLKDIMEVASFNNKKAECSMNMFDANNQMSSNQQKLSRQLSMSMRDTFDTNDTRDNDEFDSAWLDIVLSLPRYIPMLRTSYSNMKKYDRVTHRFKLRFIPKLINGWNADINLADGCTQSTTPTSLNKLNGSNLKFQLMDYEDEHYWCFNETERVQFLELNCQSRRFIEENISQQLKHLSDWIVGTLSTMLVLTLCGIIIYIKRWHIYYYYSSLKSAALVSEATKESIDNFNIMADQDPHLVYDIFISYCQNDRQWVLEELLPNVEEDISICMHERDFQIGLTILDNIVSCMDRSRSLMLIISSNFLLSHWCQFEMHLAHHRIFEVSKENLILVFLEDIPRNKRPKTLQYLMEVKTYIKWPIGKGNKEPKPEERKLFWRRLRRSLNHIGASRSESRS